MSTPDDGSPASAATVAAPAAAGSAGVSVAATTRRVPPPCWTDEETLALVNAYKDKWFALRRGNLRAADWDEVAASMSSSSPAGATVKSAIQCRHKIEKLRKRYRAEKQRCLNRPGKFSSSWDLFPLLDAMGFAPPTPSTVESCDPDLDHDDECNAGGIDGFRVKSRKLGSFDGYSDSIRDLGDRFGIRSRARNHTKSYGNFRADLDSDHDSGGGFGLKRKYNGNLKPSVDFDDDSGDEVVLVPKAIRVKSHGKPSTADFAQTGSVFPVKTFGDRSFVSPGFKPKGFNKVDTNFSPSIDYDDDIEDDRTNQRISNGWSSMPKGLRTNGYGRSHEIYNRAGGISNGYASSSRFGYEQSNANPAKEQPDAVEEVVNSIQMLTEMFVRVENSKMDMVREMEKTRMEMELKHCQMMIESQQQIVDAFAEALVGKKNKNMKKPKASHLA